MALLLFDTKGMAGPFSVQISVGGGFPVDWDIFDYNRVSKQPIQWNKTHLGSGSGIQWFDLPGFSLPADLLEHVIAWNLAASSLDDDPYDAGLTATLRDKNGKTSSVQGVWTVSQDKPTVRFFVGMS